MKRPHDAESVEVREGARRRVVRPGAGASRVACTTSCQRNSVARAPSPRREDASRKGLDELPGMKGGSSPCLVDLWRPDGLGGGELLEADLGGEAAHESGILALGPDQPAHLDVLDALELQRLCALGAPDLLQLGVQEVGLVAIAHPTPSAARSGPLPWMNVTWAMRRPPRAQEPRRGSSLLVDGSPRGGDGRIDLRQERMELSASVQPVFVEECPKLGHQVADLRRDRCIQR
jgi:hypothetical protein